MRIQCALALKSSGTAASVKGESNSSSRLSVFDTVFDVVFQQRSTADYMTCAMAQISVQSVRWPATRFSGR
jgi:hypothetical protein